MVTGTSICLIHPWVLLCFSRNPSVGYTGLNWAASKFQVPATSTHDLTGEKTLRRQSHIEVRSSWVSKGVCKEKGNSLTKTEAEMGAVGLQAKERQGRRQMSEAGQARQVPSLQSEGAQPCPHPDFGPLASRARRELPAGLGPPVWVLLGQVPNNKFLPHSGR